MNKEDDVSLIKEYVRIAQILEVTSPLGLCLNVCGMSGVRSWNSTVIVADMRAQLRATNAYVQVGKSFLAGESACSKRRGDVELSMCLHKYCRHVIFKGVDKEVE